MAMRRRIKPVINLNTSRRCSTASDVPTKSNEAENSCSNLEGNNSSYAEKHHAVSVHSNSVETDRLEVKSQNSEIKTIADTKVGDTQTTADKKADCIPNLISKITPKAEEKTETDVNTKEEIQMHFFKVGKPLRPNTANKITRAQKSAAKQGTLRLESFMIVGNISYPEHVVSVPQNNKSNVKNTEDRKASESNEVLGETEKACFTKPVTVFQRKELSGAVSAANQNNDKKIEIAPQLKRSKPIPTIINAKRMRSVPIKTIAASNVESDIDQCKGIQDNNDKTEMEDKICISNVKKSTLVASSSERRKVTVTELSQIMEAGLEVNVTNHSVNQHSEKNSSYRREQPLVNLINTRQTEKVQPAAEIASADGRMSPKMEQSCKAKNRANTEDYSFKHPLAVKHGRGNNQIGSVNHELDGPIDENIIQMDLQKLICPLSPPKAQPRQRLRPAPVINQRRNSLIESVPSPQTPDDIYGTMQPSPKRDKYYSSPYGQSPVFSPLSQAHSPQKSGRTRTESCCSTYSDASVRKLRLKQDDQLQRVDFESRFLNGVPEKRLMKMFDLIFYNPIANPMKLKQDEICLKLENIRTDIKPSVAAKLDEENVDDPDMEKIVPQLKLNEYGEIILDDTSLEIQTSAEQEARKVLANSSLIELDENTGMNGFYTRKKRTREWTADDTIKFYRCLQTIGTDFSMMVQLFPNRTRRDLKLKFKKEERMNLALINKALLNPKTFNVAELKAHFAEEECKRKEELQKWKAIKSIQANKAKQLRTYKSKAAHSLSHGDYIYENENVTRDKFSKRLPKKEEVESSTEDDYKNIKNTDNVVTDVPKPKRGRKKKIEADAPAATETETLLKPIDIKDENIMNVSDNVTELGELTFSDNMLENELHELLNVSDLEPEIPNISNVSDLEPEIPNISIVSDLDQEIANISNDAAPVESTDRTLVNLDDGSVTHVPDNDNTLSDSHSNVANNNNNNSVSTEMVDENDIQEILQELAKGNLALVSTQDTITGQVTNEIYMMDNSGNICDTPLDIPDDIIESIIAVME